MLIIYRQKPSLSARELSNTLPNCRRAFNFTNRPVRPGDAIVAWGESLPNPIEGVRILNGAPLINKFIAAEKLKIAGVETVEVSRNRPPNTTGTRPPINLGVAAAAGILSEAEARRLLQQLHIYLEAPVPPASIWLPRTFNHVGGADLLSPPARPDYWSKKVNLVEEVRIHCFQGKSIRAGKKVHNENSETHHEWIRSLGGGWRLSYTDFHSTKTMRELAAKAIEALGLDFGAVDIGKDAEGKLIVLEVNRAPGMGTENGTVEAYASAIQGWYRGVNSNQLREAA